MQQSAINFKKLRSMISLEYGIELDETSLAILAILMQELKSQFITMNKSQDEMAAQIKYAGRALQVDQEHPRWQAFWYGMGKWGLGLCLAVIAALSIFAIHLSKESTESKAIQQELTWYKQYYEAAQKTGNKPVDDAVEKKSRKKNK